MIPRTLRRTFAQRRFFSLFGKKQEPLTEQQQQQLDQLLKEQQERSAVEVAQPKVPATYSSQQFSKRRLVDFGELPRGEIPLPLESSPVAKTTTLSNGARIHSEDYGSELTAISLYMKAGSRYETLESSGAAHMLWNLAFRGDQEQSAAEIEAALHKAGFGLKVTYDRELVGYHIQARPQSAVAALELLCKHVLNPQISSSAVEGEKQRVFQNIQNINRDLHKQSIELLYYTAFRDHMMGQGVLGNKDTVHNLTTQHLEEHISRTYAGTNAVLVFSGDTTAENELRAAAEKWLGRLPATPRAPTPNMEKPLLTSSMMVVRDDEMANINSCIGYLGPGMDHPDHFKFKIFQEIIGHYNARDNGHAHLNNPALNYNSIHKFLGNSPGFDLLHCQHMASSDVSLFTTFAHANEVYDKQTYTVLPFTLGSASKNLNMVEVFRARVALFNKLLHRHAGYSTNAGIARELFYIGRRIDRTEAAKRYSALACDKLLKKFAYDYFYDADLAITIYGPTHHISDRAYYETHVNLAAKGRWYSTV